MQAHVFGATVIAYGDYTREGDDKAGRRNDGTPIEFVDLHDPDTGMLRLTLAPGVEKADQYTPVDVGCDVMGEVKAHVNGEGRARADRNPTVKLRVTSMKPASSRTNGRTPD